MWDEVFAIEWHVYFEVELKKLQVPTISWSKVRVGVENRLYVVSAADFSEE